MQVCLEYKAAARKQDPDIIVAFCHKHAEAARKKKNWKMRFYAES